MLYMLIYTSQMFTQSFHKVSDEDQIFSPPEAMSIHTHCNSFILLLYVL